MELLYIWIEEYKNIKKEGFNLNLKFRYSFEFHKKDEGIIREKINDTQIEGFFGEKIINITAIIGENGVGKTSLLEFIAGAGTSNNYILLFKEQNQFFYDTNLNVSFQTSKEFIKKSFWEQGNNNHIFYYNPFFSGKPYPISDKIITDISIDVFASTENNNFYWEEIRRQANFIYGNTDISYHDIFKFIPTDIYLYYNFPTLEGININQIEKEPDNQLFYLELSFILNVANRFTDAQKDIKKDLKQKKALKTIINSIKDISSERVDMKKLVDGFNELCRLLTKGKIKLYENFPERRDVLKDTYINIKRLAKITDGYFFKEILEIVTLLAITPAYIKLFKPSYTKNDKMVNLSSGEMALLNLFSKIYANRNRNFLHDLIILIDEGELGYHPRWQKKYLKNLIDFLPIIFKDKAIQIILTSHSPFLVSDLPKENIIFLEKDINGKSKVSQLHNHEKTFGANIHTLFSDAFFMENEGGLMSDFAKYKIIELYEELHSKKKITKGEKELFEMRINMIGEPLIRSSLFKLLEEKISDKDAIKLKIQKLKDEIKKLEQKQ